MDDLRNYELNGRMVQVGLRILRQALLRSHSEYYGVYTCHWRSRSILPLLINPKQAWWFCLPHTSWYLCTCQSSIFWMSLDTISRNFRCLPPHSYTIAHWAEPGPTVARPPFAASSTGLWESSGCETQTNLNLYSLALFQNGPFSSQSISQNSHDLTPPGEAFWSWTLINFWVWGFFGIFLDLAVSLMGTAQAKGEENSFLFLLWKFMPLYRRLIWRDSLPDCETLSWISYSL